MAKNFSLPEMWSTIESRIFKILADLNRNEPNLHREREREKGLGTRQQWQGFSKIAGTFHYSQSTNEHKRCIHSCFNPFIASKPKVAFVKYGSIAIHTIYTFTSLFDFNPIHWCPLHWNVKDKRVLVHPSRLKKPGKIIEISREANYSEVQFLFRFLRVQVFLYYTLAVKMF